MIRPIVKAGVETLRKPSKPVGFANKKIADLIADMEETLSVQKDPEGVGLAAPQIGKNLRLFIMKPTKKSPITTVINPEIVSLSKEKEVFVKRKGVMEGCLSLPHYYGPLTRNKSVTINYQVLAAQNGSYSLQAKSGTFTDFEAQVVLHEIDHLNGVLFVDRLLEANKPLYELTKDGEWIEVEL